MSNSDIGGWGYAKVTHRFSIQRYEIFSHHDFTKYIDLTVVNLTLIAHEHHPMEMRAICLIVKKKSLLRQNEIKSNLVKKPNFFVEETKKPNEKQISRLKSP